MIRSSKLSAILNFRYASGSSCSVTGASWVKLANPTLAGASWVKLAKPTLAWSATLPAHSEHHNTQRSKGVAPVIDKYNQDALVEPQHST